VAGVGVGCVVLLVPVAACSLMGDRRSVVGHAPRHLGLRVPRADRAQGHDQLRAAPGTEDDAIGWILPEYR
jgi:hypothetical protein